MPAMGAWTRSLLKWALAAWAVGASAQDGPLVLVGEPAEVRPGGTATLTIQAAGAGEDGSVLLAASAEGGPAWLAPRVWSAGPGASPRLEIELSPPAGAAGAGELAVHATNGAGFTTYATAAWRVLPPCAGAAEHDAGDGCRPCPPNQTPNAARTGCAPCPADTQRAEGEAACMDCPPGETSLAGASCGCGAACAAPSPAGKGEAPAMARAEARPTLTLTVSPTELTERASTHQPVTVTATLSAPAPAGMAFAVTFACATCESDYSIGGLRRIVVPEGSTSASAAVTFLVFDDLEADDGEVIEIGASIASHDVTKASLTLREPAEPVIVALGPSEGLAPPAACGGMAPCVLETAGMVEVGIEVLNPPAHVYRKCRLKVAQSGLNTATIKRREKLNDYQLSAGKGVRLGPTAWSAVEPLVVEYDGVTEGPEALTLRGVCGGSPNNRAHLDLRWQPVTIWIGDVPWPTLTVARPSGGHVAGAGIDCGAGERADCVHAAPRHDEVELTATADAHHRFAGWGGACSGTAPTCTVTLDADKAVSASFPATSHLLTVERPTHGRVAGPGIDCGSGTRADCEARQTAGATVRLTATADANRVLTGWSGACSGTSPTCDVHMDAARTAGAEFGPAQRWLWVTPSRRGRVTGPGIDCGDGGADCTEAYDHGTEVELTATAGTNSELVTWGGACEGTSATCALTMDANKTAGAEFQPAQRALTVERPTNGYVKAPGIDCGSGTRADCATDKDHATLLVVRATADEGYEFEAWSGDCSGPWPKCQLKLDRDLRVRATFKRRKVELTVAVTPAAGGHVTGEGISCGAGGRTDCAERYDHGTSATLTATEATGHDFEKWEGACTGTAETCTVRMTEARSATAKFKLEKRKLTVSVDGTGKVTATGIDCGTDCTEEYDYGKRVTLRAVPGTGQDFEKWEGACSESTTATCTLEMTEPRTTKAKFKPQKRRLTVAVEGTGKVTATGIDCGTDCTEEYDYGTSVTLTAAEATGHDFEKWSGACSTSTITTCTLQMTEARSATAKFKPEKRKLTVAVDGIGKVTATGIDCGTDCTEEYDYGTSVTLTAVPGTGQDFEKWEGDCSTSTTTSCTLKMTEPYSTTAKFKPQKRTLTVTVVGSGTVTGEGIDCGTDCTEEYDYGKSVKLTATKADGHDFSAWSGDCSGADCEPAMTANRTVTATFVAECEMTTIDHCTLAHSDSGTSSGACEPGYNGACSYACNNGAWSKSSNDCTVDPKCAENPTPGSAGACDPGTYSYDVTSTAVWGECQSDATSQSCRGGQESWNQTTAPVAGACSTTTHYQCAGGEDATDRMDTTKEYTWRCPGVAGEERLTCVSSAGSWKWTCKSGKTINCAAPYPYTPSSPSCGTRTVSATGVNCKMCKAGYSEKEGVCTPPTCGTAREQCAHGELVPVNDDLATATAKWSCQIDNSTDSCTEPVVCETLAKPELNDDTNNLQCVCVENASKNDDGTCVCDDGYRADGKKCERALLTVTVTPSGGGTVSGEGISCGDDCTELYDHNTKVELTASANTGYRFDSWTGCSPKAGTPEKCTVTMDGDQPVGATFVKTHRLTVTTTSGGSVSRKPSGTSCGTNCWLYDKGEVVTLTATKDTGYRFKSWTGACADSGTSKECTVTMNGNQTVGAEFVRIFTLTVTRPSGGSVSTKPPDTGISCGTDCTEVYDTGTDVTLTATPDEGYRFVSWTGCSDSRTSKECTVTMSKNRWMGATFVARHTLTVTKTGGGSVSSSPPGISCGATCEAKYDAGTTVKLTATQVATHTLSWSGCDSKTALTCDVTMNGDSEVTATYALACPSGCTASTCGTTEVCECAGASCPAAYKRHGNCMNTSARRCTGDTDGCGKSVRDTTCTATGRDGLADRPLETCLYEHRDRSILGCSHQQRTCRANITHVGCVFSPGWTPPGPIGFEDDGEWTEPANGYILPTFECGAKANTCDVAFDDETVTTEDYGVVDKDDTESEWRWECHSDNGTVRQCSLPKSGG